MLLDIKMPKRDGFEVLEWARRNGGCKCLPVIVLSASGREEDVQRAFALGANSCVQKNVSSSGLMDMARCVQSYWARHNVFPACEAGNHTKPL